MYVYIYIYVCVVLRKAIRNLIPLGHFEMIMGLDMNNVMDNNWVLFCIRRVQLPFLWLSSHSYFHAYQTTPTECARPTLRIRISSLHYVLDTSTMKPSECGNVPMSISPQGSLLDMLYSCLAEH